MPRGFRAFFPARIRFPMPGPKTRWDRCSPGLFAPLQSCFPHTAEPASRVLPSCASVARSPERSNGRRSKALTGTRVEPPLAGRPDSLEVFHQDLPSGSPDDSGVLSDGSERIWSTPCAARPVRRPDSPSEEGARAHSEECSREHAPLEGPGSCLPEGPLTCTTLSKRTVSGMALSVPCFRAPCRPGQSGRRG
jgi:hypothetical protein